MAGGVAEGDYRVLTLDDDVFAGHQDCAERMVANLAGGAGDFDRVLQVCFIGA